MQFSQFDPLGSYRQPRTTTVFHKGLCVLPAALIDPAVQKWIQWLTRSVGIPPVLFGRAKKNICEPEDIFVYKIFRDCE